LTTAVSGYRSMWLQVDERQEQKDESAVK